MSLIQKYNPSIETLCFESPKYMGDHGYREFVEKYGGFAPWEYGERRLTPLKFAEDEYLHLYLDSLTGAVEGGLVDSAKWPSQLFASPTDLAQFLDTLSTYDDCYRINDRWWLMLSKLSGGPGDEEGFITCQDIAAELEDVATELDAFNKKPKKGAAKKTKTA